MARWSGSCRPGFGRESALRALQAAGSPSHRSVTLTTIPHNVSVRASVGGLMHRPRAPSACEGLRNFARRGLIRDLQRQ